MNDIEAIWERISQKIEDSSDEMASIYDEKQEEATKKQEKALGIVNLIPAGRFFLYFNLPSREACDNI